MSAPSHFLESRPRISRRAAPTATQPPRLWGRSIDEVWQSYLSMFSVQAVRPGGEAPIESSAKYFLLLDDERRVLDFDAAGAIDRFRRRSVDFCWLRFKDPREEEFRERCVASDNGRLIRIERVYNSPRASRCRLAITRSVAVAEEWLRAADAWEARRRLMRRSKTERSVLRLQGAAYDLSVPSDVGQFAMRLVDVWENPSRRLPGIEEVRPGVWASEPEAVSEGARVVGRAWVGFNRSLREADCLVGPAVLWDCDADDDEDSSCWIPGPVGKGAPPPLGRGRGKRFRSVRNAEEPAPRRLYRFCKRLFDIVFSIVALAVTLPFYPLIALLIYVEDGLPVFFGHRRETLGGKQFRCLKFRSMRKDAEEVRRRIQTQNMCDGPQFYIDQDPRLTRAGRFLRDLQIDEWPQFWHVLTGKMSVVGPRPLPRAENQYCPAWREARLSVRPGVTGLWQIKRTRRPGRDFQEWIRYDLEYIENRSMSLDLWIVKESFLMMLRLGWRALSRRGASQSAGRSAGRADRENSPPYSSVDQVERSVGRVDESTAALPV